MCFVYLLICFCLDPPEITRPPQNQAVKGNGIAVFFCHATGDPLPTITWKKNGKKLKNTDSRYESVQPIEEGFTEEKAKVVVASWVQNLFNSLPH